MKLSVITLLALLPLAAAAQDLERTPAPDGANVYIISPAHGDVVSSPVTVRFGLSGMGVAPAGIEQDATGHHHLLIDVPDDAMPPMDRPLPATDQVRHFGGGQTSIRCSFCWATICTSRTTRRSSRSESPSRLNKASAPVVFPRAGRPPPGSSLQFSAPAFRGGSLEDPCDQRPRCRRLCLPSA